MKIYVFLNEYLIFNCIYYKLIIIKLKKKMENKFLKFLLFIICLLFNFIYCQRKISSLMKPRLNKETFLKNNSDNSTSLLNETMRLVNQTLNEITVNSTDVVNLDRNVML